MDDLVDGVLATWQKQLPGVVGLELELSKRAGILYSRFTEAASRVLVRFKLTKAEFDVLAVLRASGEPYRLKPSDLAARLWLSSGGTSNVLRRLTEAELISRAADEDDARSSWVQLTPQGIETAEETVRATSEAQRQLLGKVPEDAARAAADALRDVLLALEER
nr:Transcriptional regulator, MarR family [Kibdelosporangium sp. MJ126-NF4]